MALREVFKAENDIVMNMSNMDGRAFHTTSPKEPHSHASRPTPAPYDSPVAALFTPFHPLLTPPQTSTTAFPQQQLSSRTRSAGQPTAPPPQRPRTTSGRGVESRRTKHTTPQQQHGSPPAPAPMRMPQGYLGCYVPPLQHQIPKNTPPPPPPNRNYHRSGEHGKVQPPQQKPPPPHLHGVYPPPFAPLDQHDHYAPPPKAPPPNGLKRHRSDTSGARKTTPHTTLSGSPSLDAKKGPKVSASKSPMKSTAKASSAPPPVQQRIPITSTKDFPMSGGARHPHHHTKESPCQQRTTIRTSAPAAPPLKPLAPPEAGRRPAAPHRQSSHTENTAPTPPAAAAELPHEDVIDGLLHLQPSSSVSVTPSVVGLHKTVVVHASQFQRKVGQAILLHDKVQIRRLCELYTELETRQRHAQQTRSAFSSATSSMALYGGKPVVLVDDLSPPVMPVRREGSPTLEVPAPLSLLDHVCDPETGFTLMHLAVLSEDPELVRECVERGHSSPHRVEDLRGDTPLTLAMRHAPSCVMLLFRHGVQHTATQRQQERPNATPQERKRRISSPPLEGSSRRGPQPLSAVEFASAQPHGVLSNVTNIADRIAGRKLRTLPVERHPHRRGFDVFGNEGAVREVPPAPILATRTSLLMRHTLLHSAVSADSFSPPWPGRLDFLKLLVDAYGLKATQENALGCTPAMWAKENAAYFGGGKEEVQRILRFLEDEETKVRAKERRDPKRWLLRQVGVRLSPSLPAVEDEEDAETLDSDEDEPEPIRPPTAPRASSSAGGHLPSPSPSPREGSLQKHVGFAPEVRLVATTAAVPVPSLWKEELRRGSASPSPRGPFLSGTRPPSPQLSGTLCPGDETSRYALALAHTVSNPRHQSYLEDGSAPRGVSPSVRMAWSYLDSEARAPSLLHPDDLALQRRRCRRKNRAEKKKQQQTTGENEHQLELPRVPPPASALMALPLLRMSLVTTPAEATRWRLQCPTARVALFAVLFLLHQIKFALDTSGAVQQVWRSELWGTVWNMLFASWGLPTFFMGMLRFGLIIFFAIILGYHVFPWAVGKWLCVKLLRLPLFGAQSIEETNFNRVAFGLFFSTFYHHSERYYMLLRPIGLFGGLYVSAKVYNLFLHLLWPAAYRSWAEIPTFFLTIGSSNSNPTMAWYYRSAWLTFWGITSALDILVAVYAVDLMYQQGALNVYLPHYRYDQLANWMDIRLYPWLRAHPCIGAVLLFPARLRIRESVPWQSFSQIFGGPRAKRSARHDDDDRQEDVQVEVYPAPFQQPSPSPASGGRRAGSAEHRSGSRRGCRRRSALCAARQYRCGFLAHFRVRDGVSIASFRLSLFWEALLFLWAVCCLPLFLAAGLAQQDAYQVSVMELPSSQQVSTGTLIQAWWCIFVASWCVCCVVCSSLQEWHWPSQNVHASLSYPGGLLPVTYPHPSLLWLLLMLLIGTLDVRTLTENSRVLSHYGHPAAAPVGIAIAVLPAVLAALFWVAAVLSTSLHVMARMLRKEQEQQDLEAFGGRTCTCTKATCPWWRRAGRHAYQVWRLWAMGKHLFSLPVPAVFGVLRFLAPQLPAWELLHERPKEEELLEHVLFANNNGGTGLDSSGAALPTPTPTSSSASGATNSTSKSGGLATWKAVLGKEFAEEDVANTPGDYRVAEQRREAVYRMAATDLVDLLDSHQLLDRIASSWARRERSRHAEGRRNHHPHNTTEEDNGKWSDTSSSSSNSSGRSPCPERDAEEEVNAIDSHCVVEAGERPPPPAAPATPSGFSTQLSRDQTRSLLSVLRRRQAYVQQRRDLHRIKVMTFVECNTASRESRRGKGHSRRPHHHPEERRASQNRCTSGLSLLSDRSKSPRKSSATHPRTRQRRYDEILQDMKVNAQSHKATPRSSSRK